MQRYGVQGLFACVARRPRVLKMADVAAWPGRFLGGARVGACMRRDAPPRGGAQAGLRSTGVFMKLARGDRAARVLAGMSPSTAVGGERPSRDVPAGQSGRLIRPHLKSRQLHFGVAVHESSHRCTLPWRCVHLPAHRAGG